eukprot:scaffold945_cov82-Cylindrotheca_fusiformis.AAC.6
MSSGGSRGDDRLPRNCRGEDRFLRCLVLTDKRGEDCEGAEDEKELKECEWRVIPTPLQR